MTSSSDDRRRQPRRQVQQRQAAEAEHEHDLLRRVGDRGERVRAEDRQRQALGQQRLLEPVAAQRLAEQRARDGGGGRRHAPLLATRRGDLRRFYGSLTAAGRFLTLDLRPTGDAHPGAALAGRVSAWGDDPELFQQREERAWRTGSPRAGTYRRQSICSRSARAICRRLS